MTIYIAIALAWIARELYFHYLTHKLLNKIMSRDYADYRWADNSGKINTKPKVKVDEGEPEDFSILDGIG